jgi:Lar family restriction alleviation protein
MSELTYEAYRRIGVTLEPCKFCGQECHDLTQMEDLRVKDEDLCYVKCDHCGATGPTADTPSLAIKKWNRRPPDTAPTGEIQRYSIMGVVAADGSPSYQYTTDNPDGEWMRAEDVIAALTPTESCKTFAQKLTAEQIENDMPSPPLDEVMDTPIDQGRKG